MLANLMALGWAEHVGASRGRRRLPTGEPAATEGMHDGTMADAAQCRESLQECLGEAVRSVLSQSSLGSELAEGQRSLTDTFVDDCRRPRGPAAVADP